MAALAGILGNTLSGHLTLALGGAVAAFVIVLLTGVAATYIGEGRVAKDAPPGTDQRPE
jgi:hypothetical protein